MSLSDKATRYLGKVFGGQRSAVARLLPADQFATPFDTPIPALGPKILNEVLDAMTEIHAEHIITMILTHMKDFGPGLARTVLMEYF